MSGYEETNNELLADIAGVPRYEQSNNKLLTIIRDSGGTGGGSSDKIEDDDTELSIVNAETFGAGSVMLRDKATGDWGYYMSPVNLMLYSHVGLDGNGDYAPYIQMEGSDLTLAPNNDGYTRFMIGSGGVTVHPIGGDPAVGASGTFTSQDGKTITVTHGFITSITE
jgi:hypothetical protein